MKKDDTPYKHILCGPPQCQAYFYRMKSLQNKDKKTTNLAERPKYLVETVKH